MLKHSTQSLVVSYYAENRYVSEYVIGDLFAEIPSITSRKMFGGYGIYKHGMIFAIESRGSKPFTYVGRNGKRYAMSYWGLPEEIMEDRQALQEWVEKAVAASKSDKQAKKKKS